MQQQLETMLAMQDRMNTRVHPEWRAQNFAWYRATWIECAELLEHYGYKWWKRQEPCMEQVRLEVVDIWHFGLSMLLQGDDDHAALAARLAAALESRAPATEDLRLATEALAAEALTARRFSVTAFRDLMLTAGLTIDDLYSTYVGKNVLNFFRQDHGYQDGSYRKLWAGREDNEHLHEVLGSLDRGAADFPERLYAALGERYGAGE
ncbi:dUTP diphosphatase [Pseudohaliea rubra]|uniref:Dimeric dUTPase n=1 Tax=Pseudohaliea rubra DSM 19751 TaxID=1265313 RepID=A0A095WYC2_9GAMM|nr:dUTP diphosphatase [Pseudohaliea rubra]KGE03609.1 Dimeric dUTPase [Pseudohaliea rubra DSM 19751]